MWHITYYQYNVAGLDETILVMTVSTNSGLNETKHIDGAHASVNKFSMLQKMPSFRAK